MDLGQTDYNVPVGVAHEINIRGYVETSLIDWDGCVSAVVFLGDCNMSCVFCHDHEMLSETGPGIDEDAILENLRFQNLWIDGVVITGGEPTFNRGLPGFIDRIKSQGFKVKIDTNGTMPDVLSNLVRNGYVDYVAMDIKAPLEQKWRDPDGRRKYDIISGTRVSLEDINRSVEFLLEENVDYEFRTTLVPTFIGEEDICEIASHIRGARRYFLQPFEPTNARAARLRELQPYSPQRTAEILEAAKRFVPGARLRGKLR